MLSGPSILSPGDTLDFVAIDFETANPDLSSICQVGVAAFKNGSVARTWKSLVNPEDYFDEWNVSIHGITEADVIGAPTFPSLIADLRGFIEKHIVVSHTSFDRVALGRAIGKYGLPGIDCIWLDSARVVRRAWPEFSASGYGLANITDVLGISFNHHDAQEDARAAGEVLVRAMRETGKGLEEWLVRVNQPMHEIAMRDLIAQGGNHEGPLYGECVVFTGALPMPRVEAAKVAADAGCGVSETVNRSTTLLVVGDQDIKRLAGHEKSSKHRKAEGLIAKGQRIRILGESDFHQLVRIEEVK